MSVTSIHTSWNHKDRWKVYCNEKKQHMKSNIVIIAVVLFLVVDLLSIISYFAVISWKNSHRMQYTDVIQPHKPFTENTSVTANCYGNFNYVTCSVKYQNSSTRTVDSIKECHTTYNLDNYWASDSLKNLTDSESGRLFYKDEPFVVAMEKDRAVIGWRESNLNGSHRLRLHLLDFDADCKRSETLLALGRRGAEGHSAINVQSRDDGYDVLVGNFDACKGQLCKIHVDGEGRLVGGLVEYFRESRIEVGYDKWVLESIIKEHSLLTRKLLLQHVVTVANSSVLQDDWYASEVQSGEESGTPHRHRVTSGGDAELVYSMILYPSPLMNACQYKRNDLQILCERLVPDPYLSSDPVPTFPEFSRDDVGQRMAMRTTPEGGILLVGIGERGDYFKATLYLISSGEVKVMTRPFSGCDASARDSFVTTVIEERTSRFEYCVTQWCQSTRIFNLQRSKFNEAHCFTLNDFNPRFNRRL